MDAEGASKGGRRCYKHRSGVMRPGERRFCDDGAAFNDGNGTNRRRRFWRWSQECERRSTLLRWRQEVLRTEANVLQRRCCSGGSAGSAATVVGARRQQRRSCEQ